MMALPEGVEHQPYYEKAHRLHLDERQLHMLCHTVELDKKGKAVSKDVLNAVRQQNLQFWEGFTSGEENRQKPHLDRIVDEILTFQFTPSMFEPEKLSKNMEKYTRMSRLLTSLSDLRREFPWYFEALPAFKKRNAGRRGLHDGYLCPLLVNSANAHGYNLETRVYVDTKRAVEVYKEQTGIFQTMFQRGSQPMPTAGKDARPGG
jgi:hypothetical protein